MMEGRNGVDRSFRFVPLCRDASWRFMRLCVFVSSPKSGWERNVHDRRRGGGGGRRAEARVLRGGGRGRRRRGHITGHDVLVVVGSVVGGDGGRGGVVKVEERRTMGGGGDGNGTFAIGGRARGGPTGGRPLYRCRRRELRDGIKNTPASSSRRGALSLGWHKKRNEFKSSFSRVTWVASERGRRRRGRRPNLRLSR